MGLLIVSIIFAAIVSWDLTFYIVIHFSTCFQGPSNLLKKTAGSVKQNQMHDRKWEERIQGYEERR
jgi:hypothetical protein